MYFKFVILLISFFLATNSVMGNLEEILQRSYNYAREIYYVPTGKGLKSFDMSHFVGHVNYEYVENYFEANEITPEDQENINFELFTDIMTTVSRVKNFNLVKFLTKRIEHLELEVEECEKFYDLAKKTFNVSVEQGLTESDLIDFLGVNNEWCIKEYWEKNNISVNNRENVDLKLFINVMRGVCKSNTYYENLFIYDRLKEIKGNVVYEEEEE